MPRKESFSRCGRGCSAQESGEARGCLVTLGEDNDFPHKHKHQHSNHRQGMGELGRAFAAQEKQEAL